MAVSVMAHVRFVLVFGSANFINLAWGVLVSKVRNRCSHGIPQGAFSLCLKVHWRLVSLPQRYHLMKTAYGTCTS